MDSKLLGLRCAQCSRERINTDITTDPICPLHGQHQEAVYDFEAIKQNVDRDKIASLPKGIWRWSALLPIRDPGHIVSLHEGDGPLLHAKRLGNHLGLSALYIKDESRNPTGSFKDRGASVTLSKCREVGIRGAVLASSGNAAASFSAYSARAGIPFYGFIRKETSVVHRLQTRIYGNRIFEVEGDMVDGSRLAAELAKKRGLFHCTLPYNLYRVEGKKTLAFEICEALGWRSPDRIVVPTAGGTTALALYKGFQELAALGWVRSMPAIDVVQVDACAPIVRAWRLGEPVRRWEAPRAKSTGLGHPFPSAGNQVVEIMKKTGGVGCTISDAQAFAAARLLARTEALFVQPASAAPLATLSGDNGARVKKGEIVVTIATGSGKNQADEPLAELGESPRIASSLDALEEAEALYSPAADGFGFEAKPR